MIILMCRSYNTIEVGLNTYHQVSEVTWQCYVKYIRWAKDEYRTVSLMCQTGWSIRIGEGL